MSVLLSLFLMASLAAPDVTAADPPRTEIERLFRDYEAGRMADAWGRFSSTLRKRTGPVQLAAYLDTRRAAYGKLVSVGALRATGDPSPRSKAGERDEYAVDITFGRGTASGEFGLVKEDGVLRLDYFALPMPKDRPATLDESVLLPIVRELMDLGSRAGATALLERLAEDARPDTPEEFETARANTGRVSEWLGKLKRYTLGALQPGDRDECRNIAAEAEFERGTGEVSLMLCWQDGLWQLHRSTWEPDMSPLLIEQAFGGRLPGKATIKCPRGVELPVGGEIVCRITTPGGEAADARVKRTTRSGVAIVGVENVP